MATPRPASTCWRGSHDRTRRAGADPCARIRRRRDATTSRVVSVSERPVLDPADQRVLGSLLEKQTTVPASYPLTANALRAACNQTSSREPVVDFDEQTVERTARARKGRRPGRVVGADTRRRGVEEHPGVGEGVRL